MRWLRQLQSNALHDVCRHLDRTNAFSVDGGCGGFKHDRVASHAKTFQPKEQGTRDLGDLFEEGLRKERERMIALIKEAYGLAYEAMQMQKFYSLNPAVVASELRRATRPTAAPPSRYCNCNSAKPTDAEFMVGLHACSRVQGRAQLQSGAALSVQVARGRGTRACSTPCATARCVRWSLRYEVHYEDGHTC